MHKTKNKLISAIITTAEISLDLSKIIMACKYCMRLFIPLVVISPLGGNFLAKREPFTVRTGLL